MSYDSSTEDFTLLSRHTDEISHKTSSRYDGFTSVKEIYGFYLFSEISEKGFDNESNMLCILHHE